jgi:hypothetical protein
VIKDRYSIDYKREIYLESAMNYTTVDRSNPTGNYDFEACDRINEGEARAGTRAGFDGWLQDAPGCSTSVVNGLSQQFIHQMNLLVFSSDSASLQYAVTVMQVDAAKNPVRLQLNAGQAQSLSEGAQLAIYPAGTTDFTREEKQLPIAQITEIGATDAWAEIVKTMRAGEIEKAAQAVLLSAPVEIVRRVRLVYQQEANCLQVMKKLAIIQFS